jgi:hypothetical protein
MLPAITTTHAIPRSLPAGSVLSNEAAVRCSYCLATLGRAYDFKSREALQNSHNCVQKRVAKKPAASIPFN